MTPIIAICEDCKTRPAKVLGLCYDCYRKPPPMTTIPPKADY